MAREQHAPTALGDDWEDVEGQWLAAGRGNDVLRMQELQHRHPQRLALNRVVGSTAEGADARQQSRVSDWSGFPLETLGDSAIHAAAWNCSIGVIRFLLESGQHPDTRDDWQLTPLMVVTMRHGLPLIRCVFVDREAIPRHLVMDLRKENDERTTVTLEIVQLLLLHGADIDARNDDGKTALIVAAHDNTFEIAEMLLDRGASLDLRDQRGWTALRHSIEARGMFTTNLLIARGADIDLPDTNGIFPLRAAIQKQFINQLELFINHYALSVCESRLDFVGYILLEAVAANSFEVVKWLLREDTFVTIQFQNELGETAFHHVRSPRMVKLLLDFDSNASVLRTRTLRRKSCFHFAACKSGDPSKCTLSALLDALDSGHSQTVEADGGVSDLLSGDAGGQTPLFEAATNLKDSLAVRAAKCSALERHNAPLFPSGYQLWRVKDSGGKNSDGPVIISDRVQLCLRCWLLQTHDNESDSSEAAREVEALVCRWIALVDFAHGQREDRSPPLSVEVMLLLVFTGHTHDLLPLVLSLPLHQSTASTLLGLLTRFADSRRLRQDHMAFLQRLIMEMTAALELPSSAYPEL